MRKILKKMLPSWIKEILRKKKDALKLKECPACNQKVHRFIRLSDEYFKKWDEHKYIHSIFNLETLNIFEYSCPNCGSSDRDRLYNLFLKKKIERNKSLEVIEFAPSYMMAKRLKSYPNINYKSADLFMDNVDDKVDVTDMSIYTDNQFDIFICSHILEHVENDIKALQELYRILKPEGWGIIMAPIDLNLKSNYENKLIVNPDERWKHFGQDDHVRLYSKSGFINAISSVGFNIEQLDKYYFNEDVFSKAGINMSSVLYVVTK